MTTARELQLDTRQELLDNKRDKELLNKSWSATTDAAVAMQAAAATSADSDPGVGVHARFIAVSSAQCAVVIDCISASSVHDSLLHSGSLPALASPAQPSSV